jgi:hypothetical protein
MTINRPATASKGAKAVDAFIGSAPTGAIRGRKEQITLTIAPHRLARISDIADGMGQRRAALINRAIHELIERVAT